jgi:hypothetical protein
MNIETKIKRSIGLSQRFDYYYQYHPERYYCGNNDDRDRYDVRVCIYLGSLVEPIPCHIIRR